MTARSQSRKHRGYRTQRVIAERWKESGLFPHCKAVGAGEQGEDILDTPGVWVEVKAREQTSLVSQLKKIKKESDGERCIVVWRHNGQGENSVDDWTVTMTLADFEAYESDRQLRWGHDTS